MSDVKVKTESKQTADNKSVAQVKYERLVKYLKGKKKISDSVLHKRFTV